MAEIVLLQCTVQTRTKSYEFRAIVHSSESPKDQQIEPEFYVQYAGKVHAGRHYELELTHSPVWGIEANLGVEIHIHQNLKTKKFFWCYTPQIDRMEDAVGLFNTMCVGTAFAIEHKQDFASVLAEHPDDFFEFMASEFGIEVVR
jgi:hypothetical protein